jgi:hypothetical protein
MSGCGAPQQTATTTSEVTDQVVVAGKVYSAEQPVGGAFVRLLDSRGEFTAEVVTSPEGDYRFYAAPGTWTVRALHRAGSGQAELSASGPGVHSLNVAVA